MRLQLIRNATIKLTYANEVILIDPDLAAAFSRPSFTGRSENPMVPLPFSTDEIASDLTLILVSHLHQDHFDAVESLPKDLPVLCQPGDEVKISEHGFSNVLPIQNALGWNNITITRVGGQHGLGVVGQWMGNVSGFVFEAEGEPTLYWAGDTIYGIDVTSTLEQFQPEIIVTHSCGASWPDPDGVRQLIVMDAAETVALSQAAPKSTIIATHLEALDHATVSRDALRAAAATAGIPHDRLRIPADGETIEIGS